MKQRIILIAAVFLLLIFSAPASASEWYLSDEYGIHPESAWNLLPYVDTSDEVIVAVLSSGIDYTHPAVIPNLWNDTSGNHGTNLVTSSSDVMDTDGEGTHCAGVICSVINGGNASNIKIMSIVVGTASSMDISRKVSGIYYAVSHGAKVICIPSGAYSYTKAEYDALKSAEDAGIICICAAGDDGRNLDANPYYPASYSLSNVLSVAASNSSGEIDTSYSNYGTANVTLTAPGTKINAAYLQSKSSYKEISSTVSSAAITAGAAAIIKSVNQTMSPAEIKTLLTANSDSLTTGSKAGGVGRLNLSKSAEVAVLTITEPARLNFTVDKTLLNATGNETAVLSTAAYNRFGTLVSSNVTYTAAPDNAAEITGNIFTPKRAYADKRTEVNVTITAAAKTNISAVSSINMTILPLYPAEVTFTKQTTTLTPGQTFTFAAAVHDQTGEELNMSLNWTSSKPAIGTINATSGLFAALTPGKTTVSASVKNNTNITGSIDVTVLAKTTSSSPQNQNDHYSVKSSDTRSTHSSSSSSGGTSHTSGARQTPTPAETQQETQEPKPVVTETREAIPVITLSPSGKPVETPLSCAAVVLGILAAAIARRKM